MKKLLTLILIFCGFGIISSAQTLKPGIGLNFTDVVASGDGSANGRTGWQIGGSIAFGNKFYFEPGLFYQGKSAEFSSSDNLPEPDLDAALKGFRVPVAIGLNLLGNAESTASLRVFGGGSGFFLTDVGDDLDKDDFNSTNWGVFAGAGVDLWILFVDLSYEWSVTDLQTELSNIDFGKTNGLFLNAGLRINL